jgi:hypothetical protein
MSLELNSYSNTATAISGKLYTSDGTAYAPLGAFNSNINNTGTLHAKYHKLHWMPGEGDN